MNLILCERDEVEGDAIVRLTDGRATHVRKVLRASVGDSLQIGIVDGPKGRGEVVAIDDGCVTLQGAFDVAAPPRPAVDLLLALPRPKVLHRLWAQFAALGVDRIILTNAARVERHYFDTHVLDESTFRPLLIEGLQQACDTRLPRVSIHRQFRILIEDDLDALSDDGMRLVAHPHAQSPLTSIVSAARTSTASAVPTPTAPRRALLAIGPEGGWNAFELALLERHRFQPIGMGPRILRSDTACIALLALLHDALRASVS
jgi:16S rRNA (uracil1498-N3)-methyltransferase